MTIATDVAKMSIAALIWAVRNVPIVCVGFVGITIIYSGNTNDAITVLKMQVQVNKYLANN